MLVGKEIFCIGGGLPHTNSITHFSTETHTWTPLSPSPSSHPPPTPRVSLSAHLANNAIFVLGGCEETGKYLFILFISLFILFYFILFYFILFYFILFIYSFILFFFFFSFHLHQLLLILYFLFRSPLS